MWISRISILEFWLKQINAFHQLRKIRALVKNEQAHSFRSSLAGNDWFCYQVNMLNERLLDDLRVVVSVDEVAVIGQPADGEDDHHHDEHFDHLEWEKVDKWNEEVTGSHSLVNYGTLGKDKNSNAALGGSA